MSRVIVGEGRPRIVVTTTTAISSTVADVNNTLKIVYLSGTPNITSAVMNKFLYTKNSSNADTKGKIIQYDNDLDFVKVLGWDNGFPAIGAAAVVKDLVIDLPYSREVTEVFEPVFRKPKILYHNRKKIRDLEGFYYYVNVDYGNYSTRSMIELLASVYDAGRTGSFNFYPRSDNRNVYYECEIDGEEMIRIGQHIKNQGHKNLALNFEGLGLLTKLPFDQSLLDLGMNQLIVQDDTYSVVEAEV